ncbi:uncharacterized protein LOC131669952 isoform X1 [Phymastichus coffea]|uniref:uncharacterized protein LOC131669952 isoform X1 n=1 Tax=Phymastichus coffea TaxID=108790 RepID=UPI00273B29A6|nr:uncharacterized protein LOC131669952 isoform X1 [Phymastichus coffea]
MFSLIKSLKNEVFLVMKSKFIKQVNKKYSFKCDNELQPTECNVLCSKDERCVLDNVAKSLNQNLPDINLEDINISLNSDILSSSYATEICPNSTAIYTLVIKKASKSENSDNSLFNIESLPITIADNIEDLNIYHFDEKENVTSYEARRSLNSVHKGTDDLEMKSDAVVVNIRSPKDELQNEEFEIISTETFVNISPNEKESIKKSDGELVDLAIYSYENNDISKENVEDKTMSMVRQDLQVDDYVEINPVIECHTQNSENSSCGRRVVPWTDEEKQAIKEFIKTNGKPNRVTTNFIQQIKDANKQILAHRSIAVLRAHLHNFGYVEKS